MLFSFNTHCIAVLYLLCFMLIFFIVCLHCWKCCFHLNAIRFLLNPLYYSKLRSIQPKLPLNYMKKCVQYTRRIFIAFDMKLYFLLCLDHVVRGFVISLKYQYATIEKNSAQLLQHIETIFSSFIVIFIIYVILWQILWLKSIFGCYARK